MAVAEHAAIRDDPRRRQLPGRHRDRRRHHDGEWRHPHLQECAGDHGRTARDRPVAEVDARHRLLLTYHGSVDCPRAVLLVLAVTGCDRALGIEDTVLADARPAPLDPRDGADTCEPPDVAAWHFAPRAFPAPAVIHP